MQMSPLAYGNDGRIQFFDGVSGDCPKTDVTGTVFRKHLLIFEEENYGWLIF